MLWETYWRFRKRIRRFVNNHPALWKSIAAVKRIASRPVVALQKEPRLNRVRKLAKRMGIEGRPSGSIAIIAIDCLRYRNTSIAGYHRKTTPFFEKFPVKFKAFTAAPQTYSAVPSILTGLYPHNHGSIIGGRIKDMENIRSFKQLRDDVLVLPELLEALGYDVVFISSIYTATMPFRKTALDTIALRDDALAEEVLKKTLRLLRQSMNKGRDFIAYIHLGDLHEPLNPPKDYRSYFGEVENLPNINRWAYTRPEEQRGEEFERYKYNRILLYDNALRYVNDSLEGFIDAIRELVGDILIVVTADHGEEFWEHANIEAKYFYDPRHSYGVGHGHNVFNEVIEVPLLIMGPDTSRISRNSGKHVSLVDVVPTLIEWLGIEKGRWVLDGFSLLGSIPSSRAVLAEATSYGYEKKALIRKGWKLLYSHGDQVSWVFDLVHDPLEKEPRSDNEKLAELMTELKRLMASGLLRRTRVRLRTRESS